MTRDCFHTVILGFRDVCGELNDWFSFVTFELRHVCGQTCQLLSDCDILGVGTSVVRYGM